ncbi:S8 family peptidase [Sphingomonas lutea]|uniref:S8 family peptidase n=1 Tax=Sphingomonas lutea TaxID=1045317 RepID=UPI001F2A3311|nr:S8 family peptidase [Sphingomonas lutea]
MNYDTPEYRNSASSVAANAISAYQSGATGAGVKIAVIDSGINPDLSEFTGRIDAASADVAGSRGVSDEGGHGTAVSAIAAGARNGSNTMGVAFDATIVSLRADVPGSCATKDGCSFRDDTIARGVDIARTAGAKVINLSLGGGGISSGLMSAMSRAVQNGIVLVISAGNDGETATGGSPDEFASTPASQFPGMVIIAGSVGVDAGSSIDINQISSFSNRAGGSAEHYLTARGFQDRAPDQTGQQFLWSGTSFSAPTISGAVALLAQAFPNLSGAQIVSILMKSADDLGAAGTDSVFGRGRLNIAKAFQPQGPMSLAGSQVPVTGSAGDLPPAAGDAATGQSLGAIILDGYDRAYVANLAASLRRADIDRPLSRAIQNDIRSGAMAAGPLSVAVTVHERRDLVGSVAIDQMGIGPEDARKARLVAGSAVAKLDDRTAVAFGFAEGAKAMERKLSGNTAGAFLIAKDIAGDPGFGARREGSLAIRRKFGATGVTLSGETGEVWQEIETSATGSPYRWTSLALDRTFGATSLSGGISRLEERQSLLGGRMGAMLGGGGSTSFFVDLEARRELGRGWSAGVSARRGWTDFAAGRFQTGAYGFDLAKLGVLGAHDRLGLRIAQPLRVERGGFAALLPTAYDYATTSATHSVTHMSLAPSGREIDGEISYGSTLFGGRGLLGGNLFYRRQPGHIANSRDDAGAAIRFTLGY